MTAVFVYTAVILHFAQNDTSAALPLPLEYEKPLVDRLELLP